MTEPQQVATIVGIAVGTLTLGKAAWAVAHFFIGLSEGLKSLTNAVQQLTNRFDAHTQVMTDDLADVRERVAALESWRREVV